MGEIKLSLPVKLIVGMISGDRGLFNVACSKLSRRYGSVDFESDVSPFDYTDYYAREMGPNLMRKFVAFEQLIDPADLAKIKLFTNQLEHKLAVYRDEIMTRRINLDPGYVTDSKLVLATTKNHQHRIYLGKGIYAEVTLRFRKGTFEPWEWTYPDYRTKGYISFFNSIRKIYRQQ